MPFLTFQEESPIPFDDVATTLRRRVIKPAWFLEPDDKHLFSGSVSPSGFRVQRLIHGRNSFNPVLFGRFSPTPTGTRIRVLLTFHPLVWAFIVYLSVESVRVLVNYWGESELVRNMALFLFVTLWVLAVSSFFYGASRARSLLRDCLECSSRKDGTGEPGKGRAM